VPVPEEYVLVKLAERFGKLPHEIREMPEADYRLCLDIAGAEARANELRANRREHYGK
jgi:hypothetical protein